MHARAFNSLMSHACRFSKKLMKILLLLISLLIHWTVEAQSAAPAPRPAGPPPTKAKWHTLSGEQPLIIARGGFSGNFPENSKEANMQVDPPYSMSGSTILYCNMQLTQDGVGVCLTGLSLENATVNAKEALGNDTEPKTYKVNGKEINGYFAVDYPSTKILGLGVKQSLLSRSYIFEGLGMSTVEETASSIQVPFWMNVQYDQFYKDHNLSSVEFVQSTMRKVHYSYISCPEIGFLKSLGSKVDKDNTKLILQIKEAEEYEPTTDKKYGELVKDLSSIKSYASGILVPKEYIWPIDKTQYLQDPTTLVEDAHKAGLEVYAYNFANDYLPMSYNYSYDPSIEYLKFIDNSKFSVDGVVTDFPSTASAAIACFAHHNVSASPKKEQVLVISHNGASGDYPGCTDKAYEKAVEDGADIIDCYVQMSKDGVPFCMDTADLSASSTALTTFMSRTSSVPEIKQSNGEPKKGKGIFSFDLTWKEIQTLKPVIANPYEKGMMLRNPAYKNVGKFMTLSDFLDFAKTKGTGVFIGIQNAAYLASKKGLDIVGAVRKALKDAKLDKKSKQQVLIESDDSSVLVKFKDVPAYKRVLQIVPVIKAAPKKSVSEIKKYADAVTLRKLSILPDFDYFTKNATTVIKEMHEANISVYVGVLKNEFVTILFDYFSDPSYEVAAFVAEGVDGIISEYPATVNKYLRRGCDDNSPFSIIPAMPGSTTLGLLGQAETPEAAPLQVKDIVDPPLPPVAEISKDSKAAGDSPPPEKSPPSSAMSNAAANTSLSLLAILGLTLLFKGH